MVKNWICGASLPSKYWWFAVRQACKIKHILPTTHVPNIVTTPFELVHHKKADYIQLFPLFATSYIKFAQEGGKYRKNGKRNP